MSFGISHSKKKEKSTVTKSTKVTKNEPSSSALDLNMCKAYKKLDFNSHYSYSLIKKEAFSSYMKREETSTQKDSVIKVTAGDKSGEKICFDSATKCLITVNNYLAQHPEVEKLGIESGLSSAEYECM